VNSNSVLNVKVEGGGTQVVAHAGLHSLGRFADRVGLPVALSAALKWSTTAEHPETITPAQPTNSRE
jgi:hypothetical protein